MPEFSALSVAIALAALPSLASVELVKALRWRYLLGENPPSFAQCLRALVAGQIANALVPIRGGEVVSVGILRVEGGPVVSGTAALLGGKAIDAIGLAALAAIILGTAAFRVSELAAVALGLAALAAMIVFRRRFRELATSTWLGRKLHLAELIEVVKQLRQAHTWPLMAAITVVVIGAGMLSNCIAMSAGGVPPTFDLAARMLVTGYAAGLLPAPPARLGVYEASIVAALGSAGISLSQSLEVAVLLHACQFAELGLLLLISMLWSRVGRARQGVAQVG